MTMVKLFDVLLVVFLINLLPSWCLWAQETAPSLAPVDADQLSRGVWSLTQRREAVGNSWLVQE